MELDDFVEQGVRLYQNLHGSHSSVDNLWSLPPFSGIKKHLEKGRSCQGSVSHRQDLIDAFQGGLDFAVDCDRLAVILTKSGETVLCITEIRNESSKWYFFDSHGQSHQDSKLAYWKEFDSFFQLLDAFLIKYPPQNFGDGSLQSEMYNLFEACPIVLRRDSGIKTRAPTEKETYISMDTDAIEDAAVFYSLQPINAATVEGANEKSNQLTGGAMTPQRASTALPSDLFDVSTYQCAISMEIMADPVVCSDGKTYDRPNIEEHFERRCKAEEERIAEEEARARGEDVEEDREANGCCQCPAARKPIELTSPITGDVVTGILLPNHIVEQQIVLLVESNAFRMTDEELMDWHERRMQKRKRDEERKEEERIAREREDEMRRNAIEAEQRREEDEHQPPLPHEPWLQVRVDRDANEVAELLGEIDLGISVALADKMHRIPAAYASQENRAPRCMVACCAASLNSNQWCARCARLACDDCLGFGVTNIERHFSGNLSRICFECVSQVVDAMDSGDIRIRQKRAILIGNLEMHLTLLSNRAATKQNNIVRHEVHDEFGGRMEDIELAIGCLEGQLQRLREQVQDEERRAAEGAANDDGPEFGARTEDLRELRRQCETLECEYEESLQESEPTGDEYCLQRMLRRSDLSYRLEIARTNLAMAESSAQSGSGVSEKTISQDTASDTQLELQRLHQRLEEISIVNDQETEEQEIGRVSEITDIYVRIEELGVRLAMQQSLGIRPACSKASSTRSFPALRTLLTELQEHIVSSHKPVQRIYRGKIKELRRVVSDLETACNALESAEENPANLKELVKRAERVLLGVSHQSMNLTEPTMDILREALSELSRAREDASDDDAQDVPVTRISSTDLEEEDILAEFVHLSALDVSGLCFEEQVTHIARLSELDAILQVAEAELFRNEQEVPSTASVVEARQDIMAIGSRLAAWPLPLGLNYPTERMERQLEVLRNTLELRLVESKRSAEEYMTEQYNALVARREELEDNIANTRRALQDAESNAREEEERRRERVERRRQEEQARLAREQSLREEADRARQAAEELRRQHAAAEAATVEAFTNARVEGGARSLGGIGDLRMCRRCRAGPIENMACADLSAHNNGATDYKGRTVTSVNNPNSCPHCGWFSSDWRNWPYWDGTEGPH